MAAVQPHLTNLVLLGGGGGRLTWVSARCSSIYLIFSASSNDQNLRGNQSTAEHGRATEPMHVRVSNLIADRVKEGFC